jgi:uncharacterized protein YjbI with pentapeptide repeats
MNTEQIKETLRLHSLWLVNDLAGKRANLCGANLYGADLRSANLSGANLYGAYLRSANLSGANLYGADLRSANLSGANLYGANLYGANLYGANLCGANLYGANLRSANLCGANLRSANLRSANLSGANLSENRGLQFAQVAFTGHGECGRMLTLATIGEAKRFFCGCFQGTPEELAAYIEAGPDNLKKSRLLAMNFCLEVIDTVSI